MVKGEEYFKESQYIGNHFHEECWEPVNEYFVVSIVEKRKDEPWDVFFDQYLDDNEYESLFDGEEYQDTPTGIFLFNAKD